VAGRPLLALFAAVGLVAAAPVMAGSTGENRSTAAAEAQALLAAAVLPPDATPLAGKPDGDGEVLANPGTVGANPNFALSTAFYRSNLSVADALAFFDAHPPAEATLFASSGGETRDGHRVETRIFQRPRIPDRLGVRWLIVGATKLDGGTTGIRLDGYVVWLEAKPAEETIPASARHLTITARGRHTIRIADRARVKRIAAMLDGADIGQPDLRLCERMLATTPHPRLTFRSSETSKPLAVIQVIPDGCPYAAVQIGGRQFPALDLQFDPGPRLLKTLKKLGAY
jgi:hypothetical protein